MEMIKAFQMIEEFKSEAEARAALAWMRCQSGFLGGRVLPPRTRAWWDTSSHSQLWKLQSFLHREDDSTSWLPDGLRPVLIMESQKAALGIL